MAQLVNSHRSLLESRTLIPLGQIKAHQGLSTFNKDHKSLLELELTEPMMCCWQLCGSGSTNLLSAECTPLVQIKAHQGLSTFNKAHRSLLELELTEPRMCSWQLCGSGNLLIAQCTPFVLCNLNYENNSAYRQASETYHDSSGAPDDHHALRLPGLIIKTPLKTCTQVNQGSLRLKIGAQYRSSLQRLLEKKKTFWAEHVS